MNTNYSDLIIYFWWNDHRATLVAARRAAWSASPPPGGASVQQAAGIRDPVIQADLGALIQGSVIAGSTRETPPAAVDVHRSAKMLQG